MVCKVADTSGRFLIFPAHLFAKSAGVCNTRLHKPVTEVSKVSVTVINQGYLRTVLVNAILAVIY